MWWDWIGGKQGLRAGHYIEGSELVHKDADWQCSGKSGRIGADDYCRLCKPEIHNSRSLSSSDPAEPVCSPKLRELQFISLIPHDTSSPETRSATQPHSNETRNEDEVRYFVCFSMPITRSTQQTYSDLCRRS